MGFYFTVFVILGLVGGSAVKSSRLSLINAPLWMQGTYGRLAIFTAGLSWFFACITIFFQYSFFWFCISVAEVVLGLIISVFLPVAFNFFLLLLAPVISLVILGALWGFWYI